MGLSTVENLGSHESFKILVIGFYLKVSGDLNVLKCHWIVACKALLADVLCHRMIGGV